MTRRIRRKSEFVRRTNERDFPHLVELVLPLEGFRSVLLEIDAFHRERRIPGRRGRNRFGGECLTHTPAKPKPRTSATSSDVQ